jgi:hypothetical protein
VKDRKIEITVETYKVLVVKQRDLPGDSQTKQQRLNVDPVLVGVEQIKPGKNSESRKGHFVELTNRLLLACLNSLRDPKGSKGI